MKLKVLKFLDAVVLYALCGVIFVIPISISMIGIFTGMAIVCFLIKKILSPDFSSIKSNKMFFLLLMLFFVFMSLSLFNSGPLLSKSLKALLIKWGRFPLLLWIIIDTFRDTKRITIGAYVFLFSAALVGLTVFAQKFFGYDFLRGRASWGYIAASIGPFKNPNSLAAYLTGVIPVALTFCLWIRKRINVRLIFFSITGLLILSSVWTNCRGGWLGLAVAFIFISLIFNHSRIKKVFWPIFLSSYILLIPLVGIALFFYQNRRGSGRNILFHGAWGMIKENPFLGKGIGTFMDYCARYTNNFGTYYAHNCYLQIWAEAGIFSLLSFLLVMGYVFYRSIKAVLGAPESLNFYILTGLSAGLLGFLVQSFFEVSFYSFQLSFLFWTMLGLTVALTQKMQTPDASAGRDAGGHCST